MMMSSSLFSMLPAYLLVIVLLFLSKIGSKTQMKCSTLSVRVRKKEENCRTKEGWIRGCGAICRVPKKYSNQHLT